MATWVSLLVEFDNCRLYQYQFCLRNNGSVIKSFVQAHQGDAGFDLAVS